MNLTIIKQSKNPMIHKMILIAGGVVWLSGILAGENILLNYSNQSVFLESAPQRLPQGTPLLFSNRQPALLMLAHPQCPCTRASLGELSKLMTRLHGEVETFVIFIKPQSVNEHWVKSDLWHTANQIPGVRVVQDEDGVLARLFSSTVSGETLLYGTDGQLKFHGGITSARGHAGDSVGRSAIESFVLTGKSNLSKSPAFGCFLFQNGGK